MASEAEHTEPSSLIERLISSRNRDLATFLPFILALTSDPSSTTTNPVGDSSSPDQETRENLPTLIGSSDRIILINPFTQGMVVIEGGSDGNSSRPLSLESLFRDLLGKDGQPPASKASIEAMPAVEINELGEECVVCLEEWEVGGLAKEMPCKHRFHGECIEKWLKVHGTCPVCRYKMPVEDNDEKSSKNDENSGRRRHIWVSFAYRDNSHSGSDSSSGEGNQSGSNDSVDSTSPSPSN